MKDDDYKNMLMVISKIPELSKIFDDKFRKAIKHAQYWEKHEIGYYKTNFCLKPIKNGVQARTIDIAIKNLVLVCNSLKIQLNYDNIKEIIDLVDIKSCCILPITHLGKCQQTLPWKKLLSISNQKKFLSQLSWVRSTPGNDDFIYKNRASRIFPIKLSDTVEKKLRDKNRKFKCAIPLKDGSTPLMVATCYIDIASMLLNVNGFVKHVGSPTTETLHIFKPYYKHHFDYICNIYYDKGRRLTRKNRKSISLA